MDNSTTALQPDAQSDLSAAAIGTAGSIGTSGSISANRGAVNEVGQIVTHGETGAAVIGVSGYNGAFSSRHYVLRIKVTPPPPQLPCDAVTGMNTATAGTLPSVTSLPTSTKALILVDRQRMVGLYGATRTDALLNGGTSSPLNQVATMVNAAVLQVDGSQPSAPPTARGTRTHATSRTPMRSSARSTTSSGPTARGCRNLKFVVLLGTDQVDPSWRAAGPVLRTPPRSTRRATSLSRRAD